MPRTLCFSCSSHHPEMGVKKNLGLNFESGLPGEDEFCSCVQNHVGFHFVLIRIVSWEIGFYIHSETDGRRGKKEANEMQTH